MPIRRMVAALKGETSDQELQAHRRAGAVIYDLLYKSSQTSTWRQSPERAFERLCIWNAFALQLLGDKILEAEGRLDPLTSGYVSPQTHALVLELYLASSEWTQTAQLAQRDPDVRPGRRLPAALPDWKQARPYPRVFLEALLEAAAALQTQVLARLADFERLPNPTRGRPVRVYTFPANHAEMVQTLRRRLAQADLKHGHAARLLGPSAPPQVGQAVLKNLRLALSGYYQLGQWMAMPDLIELPKTPSTRPPSKPLTDLWRYTDPEAVPQLRRDSAAKKALEDMWEADPEPQLTQAFHEQIEAAWSQGLLGRALKPSGKPYGHHRTAPFAPVLVALEDLDLCGRSLKEGQMVALEAYRVPRSGEFRRKLVVLG
ncbi:MAG: hypothetical protein SFU83_07905 [Meiothermus sp.]|nr:hypothetical protein [Meiothermus sp.]